MQRPFHSLIYGFIYSAINVHRLNEVTLEGQRWVAQPAPRFLAGSYESLLETKDGQEWLQIESERMLSRVERNLKKLVVDVEDLQDLIKANRNYITKGQ